MRGGRRGIASAVWPLALLAACASVAPIGPLPKAQNPQQTRIYVLRDPENISEMVHPAIKVDDESLGDLPAARFVVADRAPGQHVVSLSFMQGYFPVTLTTRAGSVHYVQVAIRPYMERLLSQGVIPQAIEQASTGHSGPYMLVVLSEPEGRALLQKLMAGGEFHGPAPRE
jgi:hypothetical protein